jgi:hypothetical protein
MHLLYLIIDIKWITRNNTMHTDSKGYCSLSCAASIAVEVPSAPSFLTLDLPMPTVVGCSSCRIEGCNLGLASSGVAA